jgi:hypothetical protein
MEIVKKFGKIKSPPFESPLLGTFKHPLILLISVYLTNETATAKAEAAQTVMEKFTREKLRAESNTGRPLFR